MRNILIGAAALALMAGSAYAQGQGQGRGNDRGRDAPAAEQKGGGQGQNRGEADNRGRGRGAEGPSMAETARGQPDRGNAQARGNDARPERGGGNEARPDRGSGNEARAQRGGGNVDRGLQRAAAGSERRADRGPPATIRGAGAGAPARDVVRVRTIGELGTVARRGLIDGCPPGLAKKNPPCIPPGQARNSNRAWRSLFDRPDWWGLSGLAGTRYLYDDGYLLRLGPDGRIASYVPLLGGALAIGNPWPTFYQPVSLPPYYVDYYRLGALDRYRYADNVIYRLNPETAAITSIAALLTGDDFVVGRPMPLGYDVYNVPWGYRDRYYDRPDALYRYADGYVYQVDPETRLIAAAIELLAS